MQLSAQRFSLQGCWPLVQAAFTTAAGTAQRATRRAGFTPDVLLRNQATHQVPSRLGIIVSTSADDFAPIKQMQLMKFDGTTWQLFDEVISGSGG